MAGSEALRRKRRLASIRAFLGAVLLHLAAVLALQPMAGHARDADPAALIALDEALLESRAGTRQVRLPYVLTPEDFDQDHPIVTFRLSVGNATSSQGNLGIYIDKMSLSGRLAVNGVDIGGCAPAPLNRVRCLHQPQFFSVDDSLWRQGQNEIEVLLFATDKQPNGLSPIVIGPEEQVFRDRFRPAKLWAHDLVLMLQWMILIVGIILLFVGSTSKVGSVYTWFGAASIAYALSSLNSVIQVLWVHEWLAAWLIFSVRLVSMCLLIVSFLVFFNNPAPRIKKALLVFAALGPVIIAAFDNSRQILIVLYGPLLLLSTAALVVMIWETIRTRSRVFILASLILCLAYAVGAYDYLVLQGRTGFTQRYLTVYTNALLLIVFGGILVQNLADALVRARNANVILEQALARQERKLKEENLRMLALKEVNSRFEERERLLREMHDGLGSSLSAARIQVETGRLDPGSMKFILDDCINDFRLMLEATDPHSSLEETLIDLRYRVERQIGRTDLEVEWSIEHDGLPPLSASQRLNIGRIIQESVTNAIRHSGATRIVVESKFDRTRGELRTSIGDNGRGFDPSTVSRGKGLRNLNRRAEMLGTDLKLESDARGTKIAFALAVDELVPA